MEISGKHIILTGASSGIGKTLLEKLTQYKEVKIIAIARHVENIPTYKGKVYPFAADLSTKDGIDSLFEYVRNTIGEVDIFIANAGFGYLEKLDNPDWEHVENIFSLNVFSPIYSLEKFVLSNNKPKVFVSTISGAGLVSLPAYSLYCSTKAALHHFMQTYRYEADANTHIMNVYPVATRTEFFDKAASIKNAPLPWPVQKPEKVAKSIIKGIEKGRKTIYPSLLFRLFFPIGRAFPFLLKIYSHLEKSKVKHWLS